MKKLIPGLLLAVAVVLLIIFIPKLNNQDDVSSEDLSDSSSNENVEIMDDVEENEEVDDVATGNLEIPQECKGKDGNLIELCFEIDGEVFMLNDGIDKFDSAEEKVNVIENLVESTQSMLSAEEGVEGLFFQVIAKPLDKSSVILLANNDSPPVSEPNVLFKFDGESLSRLTDAPYYQYQFIGGFNKNQTHFVYVDSSEDNEQLKVYNVVDAKSEVIDSLPNNQSYFAGTQIYMRVTTSWKNQNILNVDVYQVSDTATYELLETKTISLN